MIIPLDCHLTFKTLILIVFVQRHEKLETSLKGFNIEKYVPSEVEIKREKGEPEGNDEEDSDNASEEENAPTTTIIKGTTVIVFNVFEIV